MATTAKIAKEKKEMREAHEKAVKELEEKNESMKTKMKDYKEEGKDKWESFKREFNHDMDELGRALKDFGVDNKK